MKNIIAKNDNFVGVRAIYLNGELVYEDRKGQTDSSNDVGKTKNSNKTISVQ